MKIYHQSRWYFNIILHLLEMAIVNSHIIYKNTELKKINYTSRAIPHIKYRISIIEHLCFEDSLIRR